MERRLLTDEFKREAVRFARQPGIRPQSDARVESNNMYLSHVRPRFKIVTSQLQLLTEATA